MLNELEKIYQENSNNSINYNENPAYLPVMSKWYKPLMERQKCGMFHWANNEIHLKLLIIFQGH